MMISLISRGRIHLLILCVSLCEAEPYPLTEDPNPVSLQQDDGERGVCLASRLRAEMAS